MHTKICKKCYIEKPLTEFHYRKNKSGTHSYCKQCAIEGAKRSYIRLQRKDSTKERAKFVKNCLYEITDQIKNQYGCMICGENTTCCLVFHHVNNGKDKHKSVSSLVCCKNFQKIISEINKCIVICHNCHAKIHFGLITDINISLCNENIDEWKIIFEQKLALYKNNIKRKHKEKTIRYCKCGKITQSKTQRCFICAMKKRRKIKRPPLEILLEQTQKLGFVQTGKLYGVSHTSIRRWISHYYKTTS